MFKAPVVTGRGHEKKILLTSLLLASAGNAQAVSVTHMWLADAINASTNSIGTDGKVGAFRFMGGAPGDAINPNSYSGASLFSGDVNGGFIDTWQANPAQSFTNGFSFAGAWARPLTTGGFYADIVNSTLTFTFSPLPWAVYLESGGTFLNMTPDSYNVLNLIPLGCTDGPDYSGGCWYAYRISFSHFVTEDDDPSYTYVGFSGNWIIEGMMASCTVEGCGPRPPIPEPETYFLMLAGLGVVGFAARRRRKHDAGSRVSV